MITAIVVALGLLGAARAEARVDATVRAGGRSSPESAIQVPTAWEGSFDPSGLLAADLRARFGAGAGPWARVALGGWAYAPDVDASLATGGLALGWRGGPEALELSVAGRYDGELFPLLPAASNGRAELLARARHPLAKGELDAQLTAVDRRFSGELGFSAAELGLGLARGWGLFGAELGLAGQGNVEEDGPPGAQARALLRLRLGQERWHLALEHRFILAFEGEVEEETRPTFTPIADYADDVDALSGGGFVQNRVGLSGGVGRGPWTGSAGALLRLRVAELEEEESVSFVRAWSAQGRVERALSPRMALFVAGGAAGATLGTGQGYVDTFGWLGAELHATGSRSGG